MRRFIPWIFFMAVLTAVFTYLPVPWTSAAADTELRQPPPGSELYAAQVVALVNEARAEYDLPPLKNNSQLALAAETYSQAMADRDFFAHCDLDWQTLPWDRITVAGYRQWNFAAENVAAGARTPAQVVNGWLNSPLHRANILSAEPRELGVGYVFAAQDGRSVRLDQDGDCQVDQVSNSAYHHYWTQNFGRIDAHYPLIINGEALATATTAVDLYLYGDGRMQSMRLRNAGGGWTPWMPYQTQLSWQLLDQPGVQTVLVELSSEADGAGRVYQAQDNILLQSVQN